jgi:hypothetical protein
MNPACEVDSTSGAKRIAVLAGRNLGDLSQGSVRVIMRGMDRIRVVEDCPDCHESVLEKSGIGQCACEGRQWQFQRAERGTAEEEKRLVENGFEFAKDAAGDLYYVGPFGHIIHLYPDGEC